MLRAYKYRIYPTDEQKVLFAKTFGCCRFVYNWALNLKIEAYKLEKKSVAYKEVQDRMVNELKKENQWLTEVNSQALLNSIRNLDTAYKNFFRDTHAVGFPASKAGRTGRVSSVRSIAAWTSERAPFPYPRQKIFLPCCTAGSRVQ